MIHLNNLLIGLLFFAMSASCNIGNQNNEDTKQQTLIDSSQSNVSNKMNQLSKDTNYIKLGPLESYKDGIFFGQTIEEWNKAIAKLAKDNKIDEIVVYNEDGSYIGIKNYNSVLINSNFKVKGIFRNPYYRIKDDPQMSKIIIDDIDRTNSFLSEIEYEYFDNQTNVDELVKQLVKVNKMKFLYGDKPVISKIISTDEYTQIDREGFLKISEKRDFGPEKIKDTTESNTESLFQNEKKYFVININFTKYLDVLFKNDNLKKIKSATVEKVFANLKYRVCSKKFSNLEPNSYMDGFQRLDIKTKKTTDSLIQKTLSK